MNCFVIVNIVVSSEKSTPSFTLPVEISVARVAEPASVHHCNAVSEVREAISSNLTYASLSSFRPLVAQTPPGAPHTAEKLRTELNHTRNRSRITARCPN